MEDYSGDHDPDVHDFLTPHIFPRQTGVATAVEAIQAWAIQSLAASVMVLSRCLATEGRPSDQGAVSRGGSARSHPRGGF